MKDNARLKVLIDEPIKDINIDEFGHKHYIETLKDIVVNGKPPFNVGLFGKWGVGKTTILDIFKEEIKNDRIKTIEFNAWKYANERIPLKRKFILDVVDSIGNDKEKKEIKKAVYKRVEHREKNLPNITNENGNTDLRLLGKAFKNFIFANWLYFLMQIFIAFIIWRFTDVDVTSIINSSIICTFVYAMSNIKNYSTNVTMVNSKGPLESLEEFESVFKEIINSHKKC